MALRDLVVSGDEERRLLAEETVRRLREEIERQAIGGKRERLPPDSLGRIFFRGQHVVMTEEAIAQGLDGPRRHERGGSSE